MPASFSLLTPPQQPTSFWLDLHPVTKVFETPELIAALASYSESIPDSRPIAADGRLDSPGDTSASLLFLRIQAAADFYSTNKTLMRSPPDVKVDISRDLPHREHNASLLTYMASP